MPSLEEVNFDDILLQDLDTNPIVPNNGNPNLLVTFDTEEFDIRNLIPNDPVPIKLNYPIRTVYKEIEVGEMHALSDLIALMEKFPIAEPHTRYNIDLAALLSVREDLIELDSMIGMNTLKTVFMEQLLYFLQKFHEPYKATTNNKEDIPVRKSMNDGLSSHSLSSHSLDQDFKHTVIYGPPGTGKTEVAKLVGRIYSKIGILKNNVFKKATRNDLVAGYLGQTAIKTRNLVKDCLGGVLFIDEAYSLGTGINSGGGQDSYSKECIDTLCESLSDCKNDLMVIVAGYQTELEEQFFSANPGLESRFVWRFSIEPYTSTELLAIFRKKVEEQGWTWLDSESVNNMEAWFKTNHKEFKSFGRDMEVLLFYVKIAHSKRVFGKSSSIIKRAITKEDLNAGFQTYLKNRKMKQKLADENTRLILESMYV
jgi:SpoVK/Ycf46/Vps4 family AAA+-type ATPase